MKTIKTDVVNTKKTAIKTAANKTEKTKPEPIAEAKTTENVKINQTEIIRDAIKSGKKREVIAKLLSTKLNKSESWGVNRLKLYENAYGVMGKNDKNLK